MRGVEVCEVYAWSGSVWEYVRCMPGLGVWECLWEFVGVCGSVWECVGLGGSVWECVRFMPSVGVWE